MYAVIEACGKQYKVEEKDVVFFEKLDAEEGKKVTFDKVILVSDDGKVQVGNPYVKGVKVEGKVVAHGKGKKIIVFKMKAKKNERKKQGHRQPYTKVEITTIKTATKKAPSNLDSKEYFYSSLIRLRTVLGSLANKLLISAYSIRNRFDIYL